MKCSNKRIVELLNDENVKIKDLADYIQVDQSIVHTWRRNEGYPSTSNMIKLSQFFDYSLDYLLCRTEEMGKGKVELISTFSDRLKSIMKNKKITTYRMTRKDNVCSSNCFNRWVTNKTIPSPETLVKLADYFNVTIDYLLGRE